MNQSATAYRQIGVRATLLGATDSLENVVSSPLPNGAECWVVENSSVYRFDKESTEAADGARIVAPIAGGGRWYRLSIAPIKIASDSVRYGSFSGNTSATPGLRVAAVILRNIPIGSSVLAYGTFSGQPPTIDNGQAMITYQSSQSTVIQEIPRSAFLENTATRRSMSACGFLGPFNQALSWLYVRWNFRSFVANAVTFAFPPDQASIVAMILPPLTKV